MSLLIGGAILGSALLGGRSSRKAANAQSAANMAQVAELRRQYNQNREDQTPFREAGVNSLNKLTELLNDPNYIQNISQQGINALDSSAAARGLYGSTGHLSDIANYVGNNAQGQYMNRLASLAGVGQTATNQIGQYGQNTSNNIASAMGNIGNARASSYLGQSNALANGLNQFMYAQGNGMFGGSPLAGMSNMDKSAWYSGAQGLPQMTYGG